MSGFILRIIAMATMLADHIGWNFIDNPMRLTWIGRIAFPIYAFLLAEGFCFVYKDKKRLIKYFSTLILLAVISEPCYDMLEFGPKFMTNFMDSQSIMFTLLLGFLGMTATELLLPSEKDNKTNRKNILVLTCTYLLIGFTNYILGANFNLVGPRLIIAYYRYIRYSRNNEKTENNRSWSKRFLCLLGIFLLYLPLYFWVRSGFGNITKWLAEIKNYLPWVGGHILAASILSLSNGKLGYHKKWFRILYKAFYPAHAFIIGAIIIRLAS